MSQGLRVMSSSLMAVRSNAIGGYHLHRLFQWEVNKSANLFRLAEVSGVIGLLLCRYLTLILITRRFFQLALDKLHRKSNIVFLHFILTMDVLVLDEVGQLSAQQLALIDIIFRHARNSSLPFGGVLIIGTFDHAQLGAIEGLPFLLSTHILTDFTLVRLEHSVRAANDPILQVSTLKYLGVVYKRERRKWKREMLMSIPASTLHFCANGNRKYKKLRGFRLGYFLPAKRRKKGSRS